MLNTLNLVAHINKKTATSDILGKTMGLGFSYHGKYKDYINEYFIRRYLYNVSLAYADLILNGDPETYLKTVTEHKPLD